MLATAERFGANLGHSQQVAALSRALMDGLIAAGQPFPEEARSLLTAAAALHETGQIVAQSSHHKHSAYLIRHAELRGFGPHDIERIAQVARYHRKSLPKPSHPEFMALPATDRALVSRLSAILRVADGLDRSHAGQTQIHALHKTSAGWTVQISGATPLDLAGARDKADLWARNSAGCNSRSWQPKQPGRPPIDPCVPRPCLTPSRLRRQPLRRRKSTVSSPKRVSDRGCARRCVPACMGGPSPQIDRQNPRAQAKQKQLPNSGSCRRPEGIGLNLF